MLTFCGVRQPFYFVCLSHRRSFHQTLRVVIYVLLFCILVSAAMNGNHFDQMDPDLNLATLSDSPDIFDCRYFTADSFKQSELDSLHQSLSIMCFNIRSFSKNFDEFNGFLDNCGHVFDVIVLTETWANDETRTLCHIPGYNSVHNYRENKRGGGVSVFIKETIRFEAIDVLNISSDAMECVGVNVTNPVSNNNTTILGAYRKPSGDVHQFITSLTEIISTHSLTHKDSLITGDFNVCLLKEGREDITDDFINMFRSFNFQPIITRPTRIGRNDSLSLIDHIWTNTHSISSHGVLISDITDHFPIFCGIHIPSR